MSSRNKPGGWAWQSGSMGDWFPEAASLVGVRDYFLYINDHQQQPSPDVIMIYLSKGYLHRMDLVHFFAYWQTCKES